MAETMRTELVFVRRDIRKYLQLNLDADKGLMLPNSRRIQDEMATIAARHLITVLIDAQQRRPSDLALVVRFDGAGHLSLPPDAHRDLMAFVEECYRTEFEQTVDQLHHYLHVPVVRAVEAFRDLYGITEDDFPLRASLRKYQRHLQRTGRSGRRGRRPLPKELLKAPWKHKEPILSNRPTLAGDQPPP